MGFGNNEGLEQEESVSYFDIGMAIFFCSGGDGGEWKAPATEATLISHLFRISHQSGVDWISRPWDRGLEGRGRTEW